MIPYDFNKLGLLHSEALTFTAAEANSTVTLSGIGSPVTSRSTI